MLTVFRARQKLSLMEQEEMIERFMRQFFDARTSTFGAIARIRQPFRMRYYGAECDWGNHPGELERSQSERIAGIQYHSTEAVVETTGGTAPSLPARYHVKRVGEGHLICQVDTQCGHLFSKGDPADCLDCGGSGWHNLNTLLKRFSLSDSAPSATIPKVLRARTPCDRDVVRFMEHHFTEAAAVRQRELQLYSQFRNHFFTPGCDLPLSGYSGAEPETESVVNTKVAATWARVITRSLSDTGEFWRRYNLRRVGETWLIVQVDLE